MVSSPPSESLPLQEFFLKEGEKRENTASPLLNCASLAKEFCSDSSAMNRAVIMGCEEPEPNHRDHSYQGSARTVPLRKRGFRGTFIISHLNQPFIISLLPF